jgi:hypothetical protein
MVVLVALVTMVATALVTFKLATARTAESSDGAGGLKEPLMERVSISS